MRQITFPPLARQVSCIGFGCGGLDGRHGLKRSARMITAALDMGITYFDVAPSYGAAEEALGKVIGASTDIVVATKVGQPHQPYHNAKSFLRETIKPVLDRATPLKRWLASQMSRSPSQAARPRYDFSMPFMERSIERSLANLRRERIDVLLAHEPHSDDLSTELALQFQSLQQGGSISSYGVGIGAMSDRWKSFGDIWQSAWPGDSWADYCHDTTYTFHRVIRNSATTPGGRTTPSAPDLIRRARMLAPDCLFIVAASTPARLRELVDAANEAS